MRTLIGILAMAGALTGPALLAADAPAGAVRVEFTHPEKFTDIDEHDWRTPPERNRHLQELQRYLEKQAPRYLKNGETLTIEFTDIDLAGDYKPQIDPALHDVRLVSRLYPPRMKFNFSQRTADGSELASGSANLRDLAFDITEPSNSSDPLRYEKRMLEKWLRKDLAG